MPAVCIYFQVHQPFRLKKYRIFDIGYDNQYFNSDGEDNLNNKRVLGKIVQKCYNPTNEILAQLLSRYPQFKVSFSFSGVVLDQLEQWFPKTLESFQRLASSKRVEVLSETYYHSLAFLYSKEEFCRQVRQHRQKIKQVFGQKPTVFRHTELIYNNELAATVAQIGFQGILTEGADHILEWRSPNLVYQPKGLKTMKLLLKNYRLSDDIAFRFSERSWSEWPLTADKFASWIAAVGSSGTVVNLFMDYETFGEHQWEDTGIFQFLAVLPGALLAYPHTTFVTPSEAIARFPAVAELDIPHFISWADLERDLSAWLSNPMQHETMNKLYALESEVLATKNDSIIEDWRRLQTSDHFYYLCTKWFADGDVHKYFNPYESPYEAFIAYMNVLQDLKLRISNSTPAHQRSNVLAAR